MTGLITVLLLQGSVQLLPQALRHVWFSGRHERSGLLVRLGPCKILSIYANLARPSQLLLPAQ